MSLLLNNPESVSVDLVLHLQDPEYCDVKIICSDGEIAANKTILGIRSPYFRSMFSSSNNFVESKAGCVKMSQTKAVMEKVVLFFYSGRMACDDLALGQMMDLMALLDLMNLPEEFSTLEKFIIKKIMDGKFAISDCLKYLENSYKLGLETVGKSLLVYLGTRYRKVPKLAELGGLSEPMIFQLLEQKFECRSHTILRFRTFVKWLSVNSMEDAAKSEALKLFNFNNFTFKELNSDVRNSGLYPVDQIMDRMGKVHAELTKTNDEGKFLLTLEDKRLYEREFDLMELQAGRLSEETVRNFCVERTGLPDSILDKIWELADQDEDGFLDKYEFTVACHLVVGAIDRDDEIPDQVVKSRLPHHSIIIFFIAASLSTDPRESVQPLGDPRSADAMPSREMYGNVWKVLSYSFT